MNHGTVLTDYYYYYYAATTDDPNHDRFGQQLLSHFKKDLQTDAIHDLGFAEK